jgi:hypothetical protein
VLVILPSPILELQHTPLPPEVLQVNERALTPNTSVVFTLDSHLSLARSLGLSHTTSTIQGKLAANQVW